jgi:hypothetical protein
VVVSDVRGRVTVQVGGRDVYPMMKRFFWWGLESGMRLRRPAKGYERRNVKMSLISSEEAPREEDKALKGQSISGIMVVVQGVPGRCIGEGRTIRWDVEGF